MFTSPVTRLSAPRVFAVLRHLLAVTLFVCVAAPALHADITDVIDRDFWADPYASPGAKMLYEVYVSPMYYPPNGFPLTVTLHLPQGVTFNSRSTWVYSSACQWTTPPVGSGGDVVCKASLTWDIDFYVYADVGANVAPNTPLKATVTFDVGTYGSVTDTQTTTVVAPTDLVATTTTDPAAKAGNPYALTVRVTNAGGAIARTPDIILTRPPGSTLPLTKPADPGWDCFLSSTKVKLTCAASDLSPGGSIQLTFQVPSDGSASSDTVHIASLMWNADSNSANNVFDVVTPLDTTVAPVAAVTTNPHTARVGFDYQVNFTVTGDGPAARNYTVTYDTPPNTVFRTLATGGMNCTTPPVDSGGKITCTASLLTGRTWDFGVILRTSTEQVVTHAFTATASNFAKPVTASLVQTVSVNAIDFGVKLWAYGSDRAGASTTLNLTLTDDSPWPVENISIAFSLPPGAALKSLAVGYPGYPCTASPCVVPSLQPHSGFTFPFSVQLPTTPGNATFSVTISAPGAITSTASTTVNVVSPVVLLTTALTPSQSRVFPGGDTQFALLVTNTGSDPTTLPVTVTGTLPSNLQIHDVSTTSGTCSAPPQLNCQVPLLGVNQSATIRFGARAQSTGNVSITATATSGTVTSNTVSAAVNVTNPVNLLTAAITSDRPSVPAGERVTYTLKVTNSGPDDAHNVVADLQTSGDAGIATVAANGFVNCVVQRPVVHCTMPLLATAASASVNITVNAPPSGGTLQASSAVSSDFNTAQPASLTIPVVTLGPADIVTAVAKDWQSGGVGDLFVNRFTIANTGSSPASGVVFDAVLSSGLTLKSITPARGTCIATHCDLGALTSGTAIEVSIVTVATRAGGEFVRGSASTTSVESSTTNDSAQTTITIAATRSRAARH